MRPFTGSTVLLVCSANRCRSPLAARVLAHRAAQAGLPWTVDSAGVRVRPGDVTETETQHVLAEIGLPTGVHEARQVDVAHLRAADLVLTAERAHRSAMLDLAPETVGRVFTLLEMERLLSVPRAGCSPVRPRSAMELARLADSARAFAAPPGSGDDLRDPIGRPIQSFRECRDLVRRAVERIVTVAAD